MPHVQVSHSWLYDDEQPCKVESLPPIKDTVTGSVGSGSIGIHFGKGERDQSEAYLGGLSLDQAEQLARQLMEVVVNARLGKFTGYVR
jgi:hypothetical protein